MKYATVLALLASAVSVAQAEEPILYYQTADHATMVCNTQKYSVVANAISHGYDFGNTAAHADWLEKQKAQKVCIPMAPGQRFLTSKASAVYLESTNSIQWVAQVLPPSAPEKPIGWVPLDHIRFIPVPRL